VNVIVWCITIPAPDGVSMVFAARTGLSKKL
jgi:hypothetical protein